MFINRSIGWRETFHICDETGAAIDKSRALWEEAHLSVRPSRPKRNLICQSAIKAALIHSLALHQMVITNLSSIFTEQQSGFCFSSACIGNYCLMQYALLQNNQRFIESFELWILKNANNLNENYIYLLAWVFYSLCKIKINGNKREKTSIEMSCS